MNTTRLEAGAGYNQDGVIKVAIYETDVFGAKVYHAKCLCCNWQTKRYDRESQAVQRAKQHKCK